VVGNLVAAVRLDEGDESTAEAHRPLVGPAATEFLHVTTLSADDGVPPELEQVLVWQTRSTRSTTGSHPRRVDHRSRSRSRDRSAMHCARMTVDHRSTARTS